MGLVLALVAFSPATNSAAQAPRAYQYIEVSTLYGPMGIGYRNLTAAESGGFTHEILSAHPIWGYGYANAWYQMNCATAAYSATPTGFWFWDGNTYGTRSRTSRAPFENGLDRQLSQVFGSHDRVKELLQAILCGSGPFTISRPTSMAWNDLLQTLSGFAGPAPAPWRTHTFREGRNALQQGAPDPASMQFALWGGNYSRRDPGTPPIIAGSPPIGGTSSAEWEAPWGRGEMFQVATQRYRVQPGFSAQDLIDSIVREEVGSFLVRRFDIRKGTDYKLTQIFGVDEDGLPRVIHIQVCQNRPDLAYSASAAYRSLEEQQIALRFVNGMTVDCR